MRSSAVPRSAAGPAAVAANQAGRDQDGAALSLGFLGTGAIAEALVTGFCERAVDFPFPIVLSPRSRERAARLQKTYPGRVTVADTMQQVLDLCDWVVLSVLPQAAAEVCRSLRFRPAHKVVSLLPDKPLTLLRAWIGPTAVLTHMIPLTFNAFCDGPIILCPPQEEAAALFGRIGYPVGLTDERQAAVLSGVTGCVTPLFGVMDALIEWLCKNGLPEALAADYVARFFQAVSLEARGLTREGIRTMATVSTPGGINLAARDSLAHAGAFAAWKQAMDEILPRLLGTVSGDP